VLAALLFAAASYYLGRSHPNNICNLMPFVALLALCAMDSHRAFSRLTAIGLAASVSAAVLSFWVYIPFDYHESRAGMPLTAAIGALDPEINQIRAGIVNPDRLGIADIGIPMNRHPAETTIWTPMDPFSLWGYIPSERRKLYIKRSAQRLGRSGWVILHGDEAEGLLNEFRAAYSVTEETCYSFDKSRYTVAHLIPIPQRRPSQ
jgi:hypothetical protein